MASEGDKYICNGVWLRCDKGAAPGKLTVLPKTVTLYGQSWATQLDAVPLVNIPSFGGCLARYGPCVPMTVKWDEVMESVSVLGQKPLLDTSTCQCAVGGQIKIFFNQQAALAAGPASLSAADAQAEQEAKEDAHFWGDIGKGLLIAAAVVGTAAIIVGSGGTALVVLGAAAATGAAVGGVGGAVAGGISGGAKGAIGGFFQGALFGALGGVAVASGAGVVAGALAIGAAGAGVASLGFLGKAYYHHPSRENGLVLVGAGAGILAGGLTGRGAMRLQQMRANATPPQQNPTPLPNLKQLVDEAHSILGEDTQRFKTTAVGRDSYGKLYIASSDERVPPAQREWATKNNVTPVKGIGHAEETIMNNIEGVEHIEPSRGVCLDCENMMKEKNVTTTAPKTGKQSRSRLQKGSLTDKVPKKRKNSGGS